MKHLLILISTFTLTIGFHGRSQIKLLDEYTISSGTYCSNSIFLYSENLYYREGGCEERSWFSNGTFTRLNDSMCVFYETKMDDFNYLIDVEFLFERTNTERFRCFYKTLDDSLVNAELYNYSLEEALAWQHSDTIKLIQDYHKTFDERDSVLAAISWNEHGPYWDNQKELNDTIVLCLEQFHFLNNKKEIIIVEPNVSQLIIHVNLPYNLLWLALNYNMKHNQIRAKQQEFEPEIVNLNKYK